MIQRFQRTSVSTVIKLTSCIYDFINNQVTEGNPSILVDIENDPSWKEVGRDYVLEKCNTFYIRIGTLTDTFVELNRPVIINMIENFAIKPFILSDLSG